MTETVVIYHAKCADGFAAAWAYWLLNRDATFVPASYGEAPPDVYGKHVIMLDFSYPRDVLTEMIDNAELFCVLDHHKTAKEDLAGLDGTRKGVEVCFDMNKSGAGLAWEWFHPHDPMPPLVAHVQDRDLWQFLIPGTKEVMAYVFAHEFDFATYSQINEQLLHDRPHVTSVGKMLMQAATKACREIIELSGFTTMVIDGAGVPVVNANHLYASEIGHMLAEGHPFAATYVDTEHGRQFSLRSRERGADVGAIARRYGGGGHAHAAGFTAPAGWTGEPVA